MDSKNVEELLASQMKSKEYTKKLFQIDGHYWSDAGEEGELHYLDDKSWKRRACRHNDFVARGGSWREQKHRFKTQLQAES